MARFVLVHGAFSGGWIWQPLAERLRALGHSAEAFDLPGLGDDRTPASAVTLDACAARLCEALAAKSERAIVVGNSMGGIIATHGAARCPDRVAALVYAAAFIPKDGQSLLDLTRLPEGAGDQVQANVVIDGDPPVAVMSAAASPAALYGACTDEVAAWATAKQKPQPVAPFATPVAIPRNALAGIDRYCIVCTQDRAIPPELQRRMSVENPCAEVVELDTDHTPHLSRPDELAEILSKVAARVSAPAARQSDARR
jgi:pimeloyl-ACP methyl ester carboxylesterase